MFHTLYLKPVQQLMKLAIIISHFQMRKLRFRKVKQPAQGHMVGVNGIEFQVGHLTSN